MSEQGLEQVISELKQRGVKAGEKEAQEVVAKAKKEADDILAKAKKEADDILAKAQSQAASTKTQLDAELKHAAGVGLEAFRQAVQSLFLVPEIDEKLQAVLDTPEFLQGILIEAVKGFAAGKGDELGLLLPAASQEKLEKAVVAKLKAKAGAGVKLRFDSGFDFGFKIAPGGGSYLFDFSEDGFREIFLRYLAPRFRKHFLVEE